jgi:hypothetical protein
MPELTGWEAVPVAGEVRFAKMADGREIAYRMMSEGDGPVIVHDVAGP